jgi:hypothetical protein
MKVPGGRQRALARATDPRPERLLGIQGLSRPGTAPSGPAISSRRVAGLPLGGASRQSLSRASAAGGRSRGAGTLRSAPRPRSSKEEGQCGGIRRPSVPAPVSEPTEMPSGCGKPPPGFWRTRIPPDPRCEESKYRGLREGLPPWSSPDRAGWLRVYVNAMSGLQQQRQRPGTINLDRVIKELWIRAVPWVQRWPFCSGRCPSAVRVPSIPSMNAWRISLLDAGCSGHQNEH